MRLSFTLMLSNIILIWFSVFLKSFYGTLRRCSVVLKLLMTFNIIWSKLNLNLIKFNDSDEIYK